MTGTEAFRQALSLLNYTDTQTGGVPGGAALHRQALPAVNRIAADLWYVGHTAPFTPLISLSEEVPLDGAAAQLALPCGVAMMMALAEGDTDNHTVFAAEYTARRAAAGVGARIADVLPAAQE